MLRHSRAETYIANKKHKESDRKHDRKHGDVVYSEQSEEDYLKKRNRFNLREYLKYAWDINI